MSNLVIVESPAKAKTIKKYLGKDYDVIASMGHVRDLPNARLSVDIKNNYEPKYSIIKGKESLVKDIKKQAADADKIYLATDPDREGEAISWHLAYILDLDLNDNNRVEFNEITKTGVNNGMSAPRSIRGMSAGRVQSVAVRIIVDREEEIRAFKPEEYWTIDAKFIPKGSRKAFPATLYLGKNKIKNKEEADKILAELEDAEFFVKDVKHGTRKKSPAPPFITSTLQQEASRKLGFQSRRTMRVAQELYEGIEIDGMGATGLITYMRTDSLRISSQAISEVTSYIGEKFGEKYLPSKPRFFKSRSNAQDGHEAIRPSMPNLEPDSIKHNLSSDQYKLYNLIWKRFVASQMAECIQKTTRADIEGNGHIFKASGYTVSFDGFTSLYVEGKDEAEEKASQLPDLEKNMPVRKREIVPNQHFTQAPPRYTEASLIKALEEHGIGRPSTYAATITTITSREYVKRESKTLVPTELGEAMVKLMKERFPKIVNLKFTAQMEQELDTVESGDVEWKALIDNFYQDFDKTLAKAKTEMDGVKIQLEEDKTDIICEKYVQKLGVKCPKCSDGDVIIKTTKRKTVFYGCSNYPKCDFVSWNEPVNERCPQCGEILFKKKGKKKILFCENKDCGYERTEKS